MMSASTASDSIRILVLHGYRQSGDIFWKRIGFLRKHFGNKIELVCPTAPLVYGPGEYMWWRASDDGKKYEGVADAIKYLNQIEERDGPFDGVVGFSQGAAVAATLCALQHHATHENGVAAEALLDTGLPSINTKLKFAIMVGGFIPRDEMMRSVLFTKEQSISVPSLHVIGEADTIVLPEKSSDLRSLFQNPQSYEHPSGHTIPSTRDCRDTLLTFINANC